MDTHGDNGRSVRVAQIHGDLNYAKRRLAQNNATPYGRGPTADLCKTQDRIHWMSEIDRLQGKLAAGSL